MSERCVVSSYNEWDELEEVIVGSVVGAAIMGFEPAMAPYFKRNDPMKDFRGAPFQAKDIDDAEEQLNGLVDLLSSQKITVKRPDVQNFCYGVRTPCFSIKNENCSACPRDTLLVVGNEIIEAPMAQRGRFFEYRAYRSLVKEYFLQGATWTVAPKASMGDDLYVEDYSLEDRAFDADSHASLTDREPCFDAASFVRFGQDIWYQRDVVTNALGVEWLKRHLRDKYRFHEIKFSDVSNRPPHHIDATFVPIKEGIILVNPDRPCIDDSLEIFKKNGWELVPAEKGILDQEYYSPMSKWISMNLLSIGNDRVIVEEKETPMIKLLESLGLKVLTCPFDKVYKFGGGVHCCTTDIRRKGELKSYFSF